MTFSKYDCGNSRALHSHSTENIFRETQVILKDDGISLF